MPDILRLTGLSTKLHSYPDQLSGGEQQRVSVARAFVNHPPLLLADEPTGNLDPETSVGIMQLLYRINRTGTTVVVATHDNAMVDRMRRRVIEVSHGSIVRDERAGSYAGHGVHARVRGADARRGHRAADRALPRAPAGRRGRGRRPRPGAGRRRMRFGFFLREALRALRRNAVPSFAAMATVLVTVLVLGVFIPVVQATTSGANEIRAKVVADVYLKAGATKRDIERVRGIIADDTPGVGRVEFISKEQAYAEEKKRNPEAYALLGANPLPDTFRVTPAKPDDIVRVRDALSPVSPSGARTVVDRSIDEVRNREEDTDKILSATRVVKLTMALLAGLLVLASLLLVANTIRLSLYARRREVEVMKLVGATDWFIRWPFVIEGMLVGALGGVLAVLLLAVVKIALVDPLAADFALIAAPQTMNFPLLVAVLIGASVGVSALGSGLSLRRFLRV